MMTTPDPVATHTLSSIGNMSCTRLSVSLLANGMVSEFENRVISSVIVLIFRTP